MYDIPSRGDVKKCIVNAEVVEGRAKPMLVLADQDEAAAAT